MTTGDVAERIGAVLAKSPARHVGLVIAVQSCGETGYWYRGLLPDGPATIFEIGSVTKTFTTTLLADMARDGSCADDPVQRYLPAGCGCRYAAARSRWRTWPRTAPGCRGSEGSALAGAHGRPAAPT